eukprot:720822_1
MESTMPQLYDKQILVRGLKPFVSKDILFLSRCHVFYAHDVQNTGVAMGSGTEIAREAADMILVDDSFGTIVHGVQEGRCIYDNIQAFINFLISCNIGEVFAVFFATLFGFPSILS